MLMLESVYQYIRSWNLLHRNLEGLGKEAKTAFLELCVFNLGGKATELFYCKFFSRLAVF